MRTGIVSALLVVVLLCSAVHMLRADFRFGMAENLGPTVNSVYDDQGPRFTPDGLELYFVSLRPGGFGDYDIWVTARNSRSDPWGVPGNLGAQINTPGPELHPSFSPDGRVLYFSNGGWWHGSTDILTSSRESTVTGWKSPERIGPPVNTNHIDAQPSISSDGLRLYFNSDRPGGLGSHDLWVVNRPSIDAPWGEPTNLGPSVNSPSVDVAASESPDGLTLVIGSNRPGGMGYFDLWISRRKSVGEPWEQAFNPGAALNSAFIDAAPTFEPDGSHLYFLSNRPGGVGTDDLRDLWRIPIIPASR